MSLLKWLGLAQSDTLNFWGDKTNRTVVLNLAIPATSDSAEIELPKGTWTFQIIGTGDTGAPAITLYTINMLGGRIQRAAQTGANFGQNMPLIFQGEPYVEKSDDFTITNLSTETLFIDIICQVIMEAES